MIILLIKTILTIGFLAMLYKCTEFDIQITDENGERLHNAEFFLALAIIIALIALCLGVIWL